MTRIPTSAQQRLDQCLEQAAQTNDVAAMWQLLEDAHVLSQASAIQHVRVHFRMLVAGIRTHDRGEVLGQLTRLIVAAPGSWTRRYPVGNTGRAAVKATQPMPIRADLSALLEPAS